jgi:hypothetical protein
LLHKTTNPPSQATHRPRENTATLLRSHGQGTDTSPPARGETVDDGYHSVAPQAAAPIHSSTPDASGTHAHSIAPSRPAQPHRPDTLLPPAFKQATPTAHGGVFFLLNVALIWELYGDFTRPRQALLSVSPWQFLHASAFALLGRPFASDPLASWLRAQAPFSRPRPASTLGGAPLSLLPSTEASWLLTATAKVNTDSRHPLGTNTRHPARPNDELQAWWPLLRQRLSLALNQPERKAIATCLNLPARVERRGDRVDVSFSLHHLPLAIRLAGLDRNPGWVPASGCDVRFHFEA